MAASVPPAATEGGNTPRGVAQDVFIGERADGRAMQTWRLLAWSGRRFVLSIDNRRSRFK
jgi:S-adenosylmethionine:diacylglycerol 3-amino-3-carboxypropyl transferase